MTALSCSRTAPESTIPRETFKRHAGGFSVQSVQFTRWRLRGSHARLAQEAAFVHADIDAQCPSAPILTVPPKIDVIGLCCHSRSGLTRISRSITECTSIHPNLAHRHRLLGQGLADTSLVGITTKVAPTDEIMNVASRRLRQKRSNLFMGISSRDLMPCVCRIRSGVAAPSGSGLCRRRPCIGCHSRGQEHLHLCDVPPPS